MLNRFIATYNFNNKNGNVWLFAPFCTMQEVNFKVSFTTDGSDANYDDMKKMVMEQVFGNLRKVDQGGVTISIQLVDSTDHAVRDKYMDYFFHGIDIKGK